MTDYTAEDVQRVYEEWEQMEEWLLGQAKILTGKTPDNVDWIDFGTTHGPMVSFEEYLYGGDREVTQYTLQDLVEANPEKTRRRLEAERAAAEKAKQARIKAQWDREVARAQEIVRQAEAGEGPK